MRNELKAANLCVALGILTLTPSAVTMEINDFRGNQPVGHRIMDNQEQNRVVYELTEGIFAEHKRLENITAQLRTFSFELNGTFQKGVRMAQELADSIKARPDSNDLIKTKFESLRMDASMQPVIRDLNRYDRIGEDLRAAEPAVQLFDELRHAMQDNRMATRFALIKDKLNAYAKEALRDSLDRSAQLKSTAIAWHNCCQTLITRYQNSLILTTRLIGALQASDEYKGVLRATLNDLYDVEELADILGVPRDDEGTGLQG